MNFNGQLVQWTTRWRAPWREAAVNSGVPNKPMVLTAPASTEEPAISSVRQHIGEPLGSQRRAAGGELQASVHRRGAEGTEASTIPRWQRATAMSCERRPEEHESGQRTTFNGQRRGEQRATGGEPRGMENMQGYGFPCWGL